jgi:NDP-sugar pyrophosphorylase family protein
MEALILAGGLGTRLRPVIGSELPKPMARIAGRPFLEYLVLQLRSAGCRDIWLLTGHGSAAIETYFGTGDAWDVRIRYSAESVPLGTGGALRLVLPRLQGERSLVLNGDSFLDAPLAELVEAHAAAASERPVGATLALVERDDASRYGRVELAADGSIRAFLEKDPRRLSGLVSAGIYVVERWVVDTIPPARPVSLEREVWPGLLDGRLRGRILSGPFTDMGVPEAYAGLQADPRPLLALAGVAEAS